MVTQAVEIESTHMMKVLRKSCVVLGAMAITLPYSLEAIAGQADVDGGARKVPRLEFLLEETVTLGADIKVGVTPRGTRNITPITGGSFVGPKLSGKILPGGWDWQVLGPKCLWLEANYFIQADDGTVINVLNKGSWCSHGGKDDPITLTTPTFEAPQGKYDWLNYGAYVGTAEDISVPGKPAVRIRFYRARF